MNEKLVRWGALLWTENISDIATIIGDDLMSKEDKESFIETAEELNIRYKNFTKEQLEQHEEFKLASEREAGIEQGIEKNRIEMINNMLSRNYSIQEISDIIGLTEEEIIRIKESN